MSPPELQLVLQGVSEFGYTHFVKTSIDFKIPSNEVEMQ